MMSPLAIINLQMEDTNISFHISDKMSLPRKDKKTPTLPWENGLGSLVAEDTGVNV